MVTRPTYDDANLILNLYEMRREERMREARAWFTAHFRPKKWEELATLVPPGSTENASFRMVISYWDMVASFIVTGVLNKELFFQSGRELLFTWERVRDLLPSIRQANGNPLEMKNLEAIAGEYIDWFNKQAPGFYEAFSKRVQGR